MIRKLTKTLVLLVLGATEVNAAIWIDADDLYLRHHIQRLADHNIITAPVTTYPLMWDSIDDDLLRANSERLPKGLQDSYAYVFHFFQQAKSSRHTNQIALSVATEAPRLSGFGHSTRERANLLISKEYLGSFWAAKLSTQLRKPSTGGSKTTFDDSYIAAIYGNWIIRAGAISQWWGPGWESSLILSDNARPLPALSLSRSNSDAFESAPLNWIGPWTFTAQMARLETQRHVPNAMLWSMRGSFKPHPSLEIGGNWSIQWGGKGQPGSLKDFWKALSSQAQCANGQNECDPSMNTKLGNQLAGIDVRWNNSLFDIPFSLYGQTIGEDSVSYIKPADKAYVWGLDLTINIAQTSVRFFAEYTETEVACGTNPNSLNCYYEHGTYHTGYRYYGRAIGTTFDNDARIVTIGAIGSTRAMNHWSAKLRVGTLNSDNIDRAPEDPLLGNTVSQVAEELVEMELEYQRPMWKGMLSLTTQISHSSYITRNSENEFNLAVRWDLRY